MVALNAGDISASQTAGAGNLDTLGRHAAAGLHCIADNLLHSAAERNAALQLGSNILSNQLSVGGGALNLNNVQVNVLAGQLGQLLFDLCALSAALADNDARLGAEDVDLNAGGAGLAVHGALDLDLGNASSVQLLLQGLADLVILNEGVAEFLLRGKPAAVPIFNNAHAHAMGINFLAHLFTSLVFLFQHNSHVAGALQDAVCTALCARHDALERGAGADVAFCDVEIVAIHVEVVFRISGSRIHQLEKGLAGGLRGVLQDSQRFVQGFVTDEVHHDRNLAGTNAGVTENSPCFHSMFLLSYLPAVLAPTWPVNLRVGANSPSLWPTMSSVTYTGTCLRPS